ncbi:MAG: hypothetical protein ACRDJC_17635 [Thermomicrobiales bacterium]
MDSSRFDAWTRRRFGLATGGAVAVVLSLSTIDGAKAKKTKRKRRCKKLGGLCKPSGKRTCCGQLRCDKKIPTAPSFCCQKLGASCTDSLHCCGDTGCVDGECILV